MHPICRSSIIGTIAIPMMKAVGSNSINGLLLTPNTSLRFSSYLLIKIPVAQAAYATKIAELRRKWPIENSAGAPVAGALLAASWVNPIERIKGLTSSIASQNFHGFLLSTTQVRMGIATMTMKKDWVEWNTQVSSLPVYERHRNKSHEVRWPG